MPEEPTQRIPVSPSPPLNGPLPLSQEPDKPDKRKTRIIIGAIVAGLVAIIAAAAVVVVSSSNSSQAKTANVTSYQQQVGTALRPLVATNVQLSTAMNAADGSQSTSNAIKVGLKNAQASLTSTQGAVGTIVVPATGKTLHSRSRKR